MQIHKITIKQQLLTSNLELDYVTNFVSIQNALIIRIPAPYQIKNELTTSRLTHS